MTFLVIKHQLSIMYMWCRQHFELLLGMSIVLVAVLFFSRGKRIDIAKIMRKFNEKHESERDIIERTYKKEEEAIVAASEKMKNKIVEAEKVHDAEIKALDEKKTVEVERLIDENDEEPELITDRLARLTGFKIYRGEK